MTYTRQSAAVTDGTSRMDICAVQAVNCDVHKKVPQVTDRTGCLDMNIVLHYKPRRHRNVGQTVVRRRRKKWQNSPHEAPGVIGHVDIYVPQRANCEMK